MKVGVSFSNTNGSKLELYQQGPYAINPSIGIDYKFYLRDKIVTMHHKITIYNSVN